MKKTKQYTVVFDYPGRGRIEVDDGNRVTVQLPFQFGETEFARGGITFENRKGILYCVTPKTVITKVIA